MFYNFLINVPLLCCLYYYKQKSNSLEKEKEKINLYIKADRIKLEKRINRLVNENKYLTNENNELEQQMVDLDSYLYEANICIEKNNKYITAIENEILERKIELVKLRKQN